MQTLDAPSLKSRVQKVNEWGNAHSGFLAVAGLALTILILARGRK